MQKQDFAKRTMQFGLRTIRVVESLPNSQTARVIGNQLLRAGTAVGANYSSALRGRSRGEIIAVVVSSIKTARARTEFHKSGFRNPK
jgi:four helix bundle protein